MGKDLCGKCNKDTAKSGPVQCSVCVKWYHVACSGVQQDEYDLMVKLHDRGIMHSWACDSCGIALKKLNENMVKMTIRMEAVEGKIDEVEKITQMVPVIDEKLEKLTAEVEKLKKTANNTQVEHDIYAEFQERTHRECNLIIHNLDEPEDTITLNKDRRAYDIEHIDNIGKITEIEFVANDEVKFIA